MVNVKNVAFKVNKQTPISQTPLQAYATVINCRKPGGKRAVRERKEVRSHHVAFTNIEGTSKRKRGDEDHGSPDGAADSTALSAPDASSSIATSLDPATLVQRWQSSKPPTRARKIKLPSKGVDLDCWFTILSFSDPAQLLVMRSKIPSCYYFLRDNPMLWKHSRNYHYGKDLPEPPSELTEYQYANLRHDHGCMSCKAPNTRKTYWAFLRRWCKTCLQSKTLKEHDALVMLRDPNGEDNSFLQNCLPSGIFDSWGNFVGVGPATTHALKTVYLLSDVQNLVADYSSLKAKNKDPLAWGAELRAWFDPKVALVEERKAFAHLMEAWEEMMRSDRTYDYSAKKLARKRFFQRKASELSPAISVREMECCPSYKRAIAIPKDPNNTSWLQLKPKLEKEAAELKANGGPSDDRIATSSLSGTSTPNSTMETQRAYNLPMISYTLGFHPGPAAPQRHSHPGPLPLQAHSHAGLMPSQSHNHTGPPPPNHPRQTLPSLQSLLQSGPQSHTSPPPPPPPPPQSHMF